MGVSLRGIYGWDNKRINPPSQCIYHHEDDPVKDGGWPTAIFTFIKCCQPWYEWLVREEAAGEEDQCQGKENKGDQRGRVGSDKAHP